MNAISKIMRAILLFVFLTLGFAAAVSAAEFEYKGKVEPTDISSQLLKYYVERFDPESFELVIDAQPADARFRNIYANITGCNISGVRLDKLRFQLLDAQFSDPKTWDADEPKCLSALEVYAECRLLQDDVNADLQKRVVGDDDDNNWKNLRIAISPSGLQGSGEYSFKLLFTFNILIEVESKLRIVRGQEVWLDDTKLKVNRIDVPEYVTDTALQKIQPILNLSDLPIPLKLHKVIFNEKEALFESRKLPEKIKGITYVFNR